MPGLTEVRRGMPVWAQVAIAHLSAGEALPQVDRGIAGLDAGGAEGQRRFDPEVGREVFAIRRHVAARPLYPQRADAPVTGPRSDTITECTNGQTGSRGLPR